MGDVGDDDSDSDGGGDADELDELMWSLAAPRAKKPIKAAAANVEYGSQRGKKCEGNISYIESVFFAFRNYLVKLLREDILLWAVKEATITLFEHAHQLYSRPFNIYFVFWFQLQTVCDAMLKT